jgi:oligoribonuclease NrnB/cAMP/cGMP phosphodiesterase (DHH superfamily)
MDMSQPLCIYHGKCADGFTAAWAVRAALGSDVEYYPGVHQDQPPDVSGRDVIMVDFSYKRAVLHEMAAKARTIVILDHHKTAQEDLAGLPPPLDGYWSPAAMEQWQRECNSPNALLALFDMERSGAQIAWDYFMPRHPRPNLVDYVGDRDLWRFSLPLSREVNAYIFAHDYTFENWDWLNALMHDSMGVQQAADMGGAIEKKHHKDVAELVSVMRRRMVIGGHDVPVANIPYTLTSDAGHLMAQGEPFAACYWDTPDGRVFSLRSSDVGLDVSEIAKGYGGGGHSKASGFRMPIGWEGDRA